MAMRASYTKQTKGNKAEYVVKDPRPGKPVQVLGSADAAMEAMAKIDAEIDAVEVKAASGVTVRANPKGGKLNSGGDAKGNISLTIGRQRFPITLYAAQLHELFASDAAMQVAGIILSQGDSLDWKDAESRARATTWATQLTAPKVEAPTAAQ